MKVTCPLCHADVTETRVPLAIAGTTLPVYQCIDCRKMDGQRACVFVLMPDDVKMNPDDVAAYLEARRAGKTRTEALKKVKPLE